MATDTRPVRVLAVDGGGIRGIIPAVMLGALQARVSRPLTECFDVIAGTSTGGLIAAGLCTPDADGGPRYTTDDLLGFYTGDCRQIFHRSLLWAAESLDGMNRPKYPADGMEQFLLTRFGDLALSEALRTLVLVTYDLVNRRPVIFNSAKAADESGDNYLLRDACRATTAAPTYFPPAFVSSTDGTSREFVDGGVCANDPTLTAYVVAEQRYPGRPQWILSLGTGRMTEPIDGAQAKHWGAIEWALHMLDVLSDGQSGISEACLRHMVRTRADDGFIYERLQPDVPAGLGRMDDTSEANLEGLQAITHQYCAENARLLDEIAARLESSPD